MSNGRRQYTLELLVPSSRFSPPPVPLKDKKGGELYHGHGAAVSAGRVLRSRVPSVGGQGQGLRVPCSAGSGSHQLDRDVGRVVSHGGALAVGGGKGRENGRRVSRGHLDWQAVTLSGFGLDGYGAFVHRNVSLL